MLNPRRDCSFIINGLRSPDTADTDRNKLREVKGLPPGHTAGHWQMKDGDFEYRGKRKWEALIEHTQCITLF